jgi:hypothetical protein
MRCVPHNMNFYFRSLIYRVRMEITSPHELNSIGWDITLYVQEPGFEPQTLHLSTFKVEFQATRLPTKKKWKLQDSTKINICIDTNWHSQTYI